MGTIDTPSAAVAERDTLGYAKTSQAPARPSTTREVDRRYCDWRRTGNSYQGDFAGGGICPQRRSQGREGEGSAINSRKTTGNSEVSRKPPLGEKAAIALFGHRDNLLCRQPRQGGETSMTVCIAARSRDVIFLVSDRMITSGDIQFEPQSLKILALTSSISVMAAGDSAFHSEVTQEVYKLIHDRVQLEPDNWWIVKDVAELYVRCRNNAKLRRSEAAILAPLGLDRHSWLAQQHIMDQQLVRELAREMINFSVPDVTVIIAGVDNYNGSPMPHIFTVTNDYISCDDITGFSAIGSGARHAESQFMLAGHAWNSDLHSTAALAYRAKKDAEVAPGVGKYTDMQMIGPGLGQTTSVRTEIQEKIEVEYKKMQAQYLAIQANLNKEVSEYVNSLPAGEAAPTQVSKSEAPKAITSGPSGTG